MRSHDNRTPERRLARLARWLGFDRNPLRRGTDRIEAALRLVMLIMLATAVPTAAVLAGQQADHMALNQAHAQQAADHLVNAVLLEQAPASGIPDPYTSVQYAWVLARWQPPGLPPRTGEVLALAGARKGSTVRTWIAPSGAVTNPPLEPPRHRRRRLHRRRRDLPRIVAGAAGLGRARAPGARPQAAERLGGRVAGERPALERPRPLRPSLSSRALEVGVW